MYPVGTPSCSWGVFEAHFPRYKALIKRIPHWYSFFMHLTKLIAMTNYTTLQQLMNSFRQGLFFNLSNSEWKLPNGIARLLEVDETGCCWFLFHVNAEQAVNYDQEFPARIRLYEKGRDCYVEANGKGVILTDPEDWAACSKISYGMAQALRYHGLIVRFRIQHMLAPQAPGVLGALAHRLAALQHDGAKSHLRKHQRRQDAARPHADDDRALRQAGRCAGNEAVVHVGCGVYVRNALEARQHGGFIRQLDVERIDQEDVRALACVVAALEYRTGQQFAGRDAQPLEHGGTQRLVRGIEGQLDFG